mgnify:CR=1 FL=1
MRRLRAAFIMLLLVPLSVPAQNLPDLGDAAQADLSPSLERRIGESLWRQARVRERNYIDDPEINGYLNSLADRLIAKLPASQQDFELFALRDPLYREAAHFVIETGRPSVATVVNMITMQLELAGHLPLNHQAAPAPRS